MEGRAELGRGTADVTVEMHVERTGTTVTIRGLSTGVTGQVVVETRG